MVIYANGNTAIVSNGVKISISGQGIIDKDEIVDASITSLDMEGSFGYTIQPKITKTAAFTQNDIDKGLHLNLMCSN